MITPNELLFLGYQGLDERFVEIVVLVVEGGSSNDGRQVQLWRTRYHVHEGWSCQDRWVHPEFRPGTKGPIRKGRCVNLLLLNEVGGLVSGLIVLKCDVVAHEV